MNRTKIFLSCGQRSELGETIIAERIRHRLEELGYEVYIAVEQQSLRGLIENIFQELSSSEYFLFIDFRREQLVLPEKADDDHRGSLFSNQELALAAYLEMPVIAFQENGVKKTDGVMSFMQTNCQQFKDRGLLVPAIVDQVRKRWDPNWKAQLALELETQTADAKMQVPFAPHEVRIVESRWFHVRVKNLHRSKLALNCYAYLKRALNTQTQEEIPLETVEFKWTGTKLPAVMIGPKSQRCFDAICILHERPAEPLFQANVLSDSTRHFPSIRGPGVFELTYEVVSENFPPVEKTFTLTLSNSLDEVKLGDVKIE